MAEPTVTPTTGRALVLAGVAGAVGSWVVVRATEALGGEPPSLSWVAVWLLGVVAAGVLALAYAVRRANRPGRPRPEPGAALARLALGRAALLVGVALAVGYVVFALLFVARFDAPAPRERVVRGLVAALASAAVALAGWLVERWSRGSWDRDETPGDPRG